MNGKQIKKVIIADKSRIPPNAIDVEESIISSILIDHDVSEYLKDKLQCEHFYKEQHKLIYDAIKAIWEKRIPVTTISLLHELKENKTLQNCGGAYSIAELSNKKYFSVNEIDFWFVVLVNKYLLRESIEKSHIFIDNCYDTNIEANEIIPKFINDIKQYDGSEYYVKQETTESVFLKSIEASKEVKDKGGIIGSKTGIHELDDAICGIVPGRLYVIAARPRVGKSSLVKSIFCNLIKQEIKCKMFSLEMSKLECMMGFITEFAEIDNQRYQKGLITEEEWKRVETYRHQISKYLEINDDAKLTIGSFEREVKRFATAGGKVVAIDYLQLMSFTHEEKREFNIREQQIAYLSRNIKRIAKEYNVAVFELAQLSRDVEKRGGDKRPILADLRESGAIEQDAPVIIFIHRPEADGVVTDSKNNDIRGQAKLIIAKNRFGPMTDVKVKYIPNITKFDNLHEQVKQEELFINQEEDPF